MSEAQRNSDRLECRDLPPASGTVARLVWPTRAMLGEGPIWSASNATLRYVDIKGGAIHSFHPGSGHHETLAVSGEPSFIVPTDDDSFIVGSRDGLYKLGSTGLGACIATIGMPSHNRTNDATVDHLGRLWFGTMDDEEQRTSGAIYCFAGGDLHHMGGEAVVTNGPAVSGNGRILYHVDSVGRTIWRREIGTGLTLGAPERFVQFEQHEGCPDGIVVDSDDCLWVALWDGWGVNRYAADGRLLQRIEMPCARVTKLAFGGNDLRTAFVTTARIGLSDDELAAQPEAGGLFAFDAPVAGRPLPAVARPGIAGKH